MPPTPTEVAIVRRIEDGFLCPPGHPGTGKPNEHSFVYLPVSGITHPLQFFRFRVAHRPDDPGAEHFVLNATAAADPSHTAVHELPHIERAFPSAAHTLLLDARTGWARARLSQGTTGARPEWAAACVAVMCASAAWDESAPIVVDLEGTEFAVSPVHGRDFWTATLHRTRPSALSLEHEVNRYEIDFPQRG